MQNNSHHALLPITRAANEGNVDAHTLLFLLGLRNRDTLAEPNVPNPFALLFRPMPASFIYLLLPFCPLAQRRLFAALLNFITPGSRPRTTPPASSIVSRTCTSRDYDPSSRHVAIASNASTRTAGGKRKNWRGNAGFLRYRRNKIKPSHHPSSGVPPIQGSVPKTSFRRH